MQERTVRELTGEIWAELDQIIRSGISPFDHFQDKPELFLGCIDLIIGVLARYDGFLIVNDKDMPVTPLAYSEDEIENNS